MAHRNEPPYCELCKLPWNKCKGHGRATVDVDPVIEYERDARSKRCQDRPKQWKGSEPVRCDACNEPFGEFFVDGRTHPDSPWRGKWGLLCVSCHAAHGVGFGLGRGQKYETKSRNKVEG